MIIKSIKKIIVIVLIILLCTMNIAQAVPVKENREDSSTQPSLEEAEQNLVNFAIRFAQTRSDDTWYYGSSEYQVFSRRNATYRLVDNIFNFDPFTYTGRFEFDCVGWVNFAVHYVYQIDCGANGSNDLCFVSPNGVRNGAFTQLWDISQRKPGDILIFGSAPHVGIYIGNNNGVEQMVDCGQKNGKNRAVHITNIPGLKYKSSSGTWSLTSIAKLRTLDGVNVRNIPGGYTVNSSVWVGQDTVNLDAVISQFEFTGMPIDVTDAGSHSFMYYIDKITKALDYIIGVMFNGIKVVIVAIIDGTQNAITKAFDFLSNGPEENNVELVTNDS